MGWNNLSSLSRHLFSQVKRNLWGKLKIKDDEFKLIEGGLSGQYLMDESTKKLSYIRNKSNNMPLIGVGGVMSKNDFFEKIDAGANLVQLYTGFIIKGPNLINQILKD